MTQLGFERRFRRMRVTPDVFIRFCKEPVGPTRPILNALPKDTAFVSHIKDDFTGWLELIVWSSEFDNLPEGYVVPHHPDIHMREEPSFYVTQFFCITCQWTFWMKWPVGDWIVTCPLCHREGLQGTPKKIWIES